MNSCKQHLGSGFHKGCRLLLFCVGHAFSCGLEEHLQFLRRRKICCMMWSAPQITSTWRLLAAAFSFVDKLRNMVIFSQTKWPTMPCRLESSGEIALTPGHGRPERAARKPRSCWVLFDPFLSKIITCNVFTSPMEEGRVGHPYIYI